MLVCETACAVQRFWQVTRTTDRRLHRALLTPPPAPVALHCPSPCRSLHPPPLQRKLLGASFLRNTDRTDGNARSSRSREPLGLHVV